MTMHTYHIWLRGNAHMIVIEHVARHLLMEGTESDFLHCDELQLYLDDDVDEIIAVFRWSEVAGFAMFKERGK